MELWLWLLIGFWVVFGIGMYLLYRNGFAVTEVIAAVVLLFWPGKVVTGSEPFPAPAGSGIGAGSGKAAGTASPLTTG